MAIIVSRAGYGWGRQVPDDTRLRLVRVSIAVSEDSQLLDDMLSLR